MPPTGETTSETPDAPPREPAFLRASFALEVTRGANESTIADGAINVRLPSSEVVDGLIPILSELLPLVASRFGVKCEVATGGAHVAGCGKAPPAPPAGWPSASPWPP